MPGVGSPTQWHWWLLPSLRRCLRQRAESLRHGLQIGPAGGRAYKPTVQACLSIGAAVPRRPRRGLPLGSRSFGAVLAFLRRGRALMRQAGSGVVTIPIWGQFRYVATRGAVQAGLKRVDKGRYLCPYLSESVTVLVPKCWSIVAKRSNARQRSVL